MARDLLGDLEERFDRLRQEFLPALGGATRPPACDVRDAGHEFVLTFEMPGVRREGLEVEVGAEEVRVRGRVREDRQEQGEGWIRRERHTRVFERRVPVPDAGSPEGARAALHDGVLEVHVPKAEPERHSRRRLDVE